MLLKKRIISILSIIDNSNNTVFCGKVPIRRSYKSKSHICPDCSLNIYCRGWGMKYDVRCCFNKFGKSDLIHNLGNLDIYSIYLSDVIKYIPRDILENMGIVEKLKTKNKVWKYKDPKERINNKFISKKQNNYIKNYKFRRR